MCRFLKLIWFNPKDTSISRLLIYDIWPPRALNSQVAYVISRKKSASYQSSLVRSLLIKRGFFSFCTPFATQIHPVPTGFCQSAAVARILLTTLPVNATELSIHVLPEQVANRFRSLGQIATVAAAVQKAAATGIATAADIELESTQAPRTHSHFSTLPEIRFYCLHNKTKRRREPTRTYKCQFKKHSRYIYYIMPGYLPKCR